MAVEMLACERCHARKTKCDRRQPRCSSCSKSHTPCHYRNRRRDRQEYIRSMEQRLRALQSENDRLRQTVLGVSPESPGGAALHSLRPSGPGPEVGTGITEVGTAPTEDGTADVFDVEKPSSPLYIVPHTPPTPASSRPHAAGEEARYLGSSNGVGFVDVVERVVDASHTDGLFGRMSDSQLARRPGSLRPALPHAPQPALLADEAVARPLMRAYFAHWHLTFPLLYRPAFFAMVRRLYAAPARYRDDAAAAFCFDIVLALGSVPAKRVDWGFSDAEAHFARALTRLDEVVALRDIRSLQALLLYCKYSIHASLRDTSSDTWAVLGRATRLVVELGLHQHASSGLPRCETHIAGRLPGGLQVEMQRRSFWSFYNLERIVNISLGRPLNIHDDDIDVLLPSPADDEALLGAAAPAPRGRTITPFLHHIQYRRIQSRIHRSMYTSRQVQVLPLAKRQAIRRELYEKLQAWHRDTARVALDVPAAKGSLDGSSSGDRHEAQNAAGGSTPPSSFLNLGWYHALYHSACLMLFRPSATFPAMVEGGDSDDESDDVLRMIWTSSRCVLKRYVELLRTRHLNHSWVCLYVIFMAGLANVYGVGCCARRRKRLPGRCGAAPFVPSLLDVVADFRDCSNVLTAICERWHDVRSSCDIFSRLSMSALKELTAVSCPDGAETVVNGSGSSNGQLLLPDAARSLDTPLGLDDIMPADIMPADIPVDMPVDMPVDTTGDQDHGLAGFSSIDDLQQLFQEMQNSVHTGDYGKDEVAWGFSQEWFER